MNPSAWQANLHLGFSRQGERTLLSRKTRHGPLTVQRPFYPEGDVCHVYLLHPPGGVVGGDCLAIDIAVQAAAHALITTPAAGKFYRSDGRRASQTVRLRLEDQARLEWLPQETLFYQGTLSETRVRVELMPHSVFIGWDIFSLGRPAAGEGFAEGQVDLRWAIYRAGRPLLLERLALDATAFVSVAGLAGHAMAGSLYAYPATPPHLHAVQAMIAEHPQAGATLVDDLLIVRVMDQRIGPLQECLRSVWQHLRPALLGRHASPPRIWAT